MKCKKAQQQNRKNIVCGVSQTREKCLTFLLNNNSKKREREAKERRGKKGLR
jgi:hypothetical protein